MAEQLFESQEQFLDQHKDRLAEVPDPRTYREKYDDDHFTPVMKPTGEHRFDNRIEEFNRMGRQSKDHLLPFAQRIAAHFEHYKGKEVDAANAESEQKKHLRSVKPLTDEIDATYQRLLADNSSYDRRDFAALEKAKKQAETPGADIGIAISFLAQIAEKENAILDKREQDHEARIKSLKRELADLRKSRGKSVALPSNAVKPTFVEFWASLDARRSDHGYTPQYVAQRKYEERYGQE